MSFRARCWGMLMPSEALLAYFWGPIALDAMFDPEIESLLVRVIVVGIFAYPTPVTPVAPLYAVFGADLALKVLQDLIDYRRRD